MIVYLNRKFISEKKAAISIHDHGFLYGDGVYETLRVYNGTVFLLDDHLNRLKKSLHGIGLKIPPTLSSLGTAVQKLISTNRHKDAAVRITVTRGPGGHGFDPNLCKEPTVLITSRPYSGPSPALVKKGMRVAVVSVRRNNPEALPPSIKSTSCLNNVLAKMEANRLKADEAIMLSDDGTVAEGTVTNVFLVKKDQLFTPVLDGRQLPGVTRALVCKLARESGIRVSETKVWLRDLQTTDHVFLTSSLIEIMPVREILFPDHESSLKMSEVGGVTQQLIGCFKGILKTLKK